MDRLLMLFVGDTSFLLNKDSKRFKNSHEIGILDGWPVVWNK